MVAAHLGYPLELRSLEVNAAQRQAPENTQGYLTSVRLHELSRGGMHGEQSTSTLKAAPSQKGRCGAGLINQHMAKSNASVLHPLVFLLQESTGTPKAHFSLTETVLLKYI